MTIIRHRIKNNPLHSAFCFTLFQSQIIALSSLARLRLLNVLPVRLRRLNPRRLDIIFDLELELFRLPALFFLFTLFLMPCVGDAAVSRPESSVGVIAGATGDAEICFVNETDWRIAEVRQDLLTGDGLRTGDYGALALVFHDRTQIRVQRNSSLVVKAISKGKNEGQSVFKLNRGGAWARSPSGRAGVRIETPSATAAIRGTDWSLTVDERGRTTLIVLSGEVVLQNPLGRVTVTRGEIAFAEIGKAPSKTILVSPNDRNQLYYNMSLSDTMRLFKLTTLKTKERRLARKTIESIPKAGRTPRQWLDLAELAYDMGDMPAVTEALAFCPRSADTRARIRLVEGYLSVFKDDFAKSARILADAEDGLDPDRRLMARIGRTGSLIMTRQTDSAKDLIRWMDQENSSAPSYLMLKVILTAFSGDLIAASSLASEYSVRFPDNASFPALKGLLALLLDRREEARNAAHQTLAIDPEDAIAYKILGHYLADYLHDSEGGVDVIQKGLCFNENNADLWGTLGWIYLGMNEAKQSEYALKKALRLVPNDMADLFNYLILMLDQFRMTEAGELLAKMTDIEPARDFLLTGQGRFALQMDRVTEARDVFLKATTVNPMMSEASLGLAIACQQAGETGLARQTLDNAGRMAPNDPNIPLTAAIMALDQAEADAAIGYAREAIRRYRMVEGSGISGLAATRAGNNTLGAAFSNLSLTTWADYYNELSFDPYSAESHFYRAIHEEDGYSSLYQGLLLEPLACSARNRFVDFFRRPFMDTEIGGTLGWPGEGVRYGENVNIQGFSHSILPVSYYLNFQNDDSPGFRQDNDEKRISNGSGLAGFNLTPHDRLLVDVNVADKNMGLPGTVLLPDMDDETDAKMIQEGMGYSHFFSARNIFMGRILYYQVETEFQNADPVGANLSVMDYSLIANFGVEASKMLHDAGLIDITSPDDPNSPILLIGQDAETIPDTISPGLDTKTASRIFSKNRNLSLQLRHMVTVDRVDLSYGAEAMTLDTRDRLRSLDFQQRTPGIGTIIGPTGTLNFLYGDPVTTSSHSSHDGYSGYTHVNALWRIDKRFWTEAGLYAVHYDDGEDTDFSELEPRTGAAWQPDDRNWLRLVFRKDSRLPALTTLAPVATVGLTGSEAFVSQGGRSTLGLARWDREWLPSFFTALQVGRQKIKSFNANGPENSLDTYAVSRGQIDHAALSANYWLKGGFGFYGEAVFRDTENFSDDDQGHTDLPLVPAQSYRTGVTWIHPAQVRLDIVGNIARHRPADISARQDLDDYGTVDFLTTWQPLEKRLEIGFALNNIFDADYDLAKDMPGPGRNVTVNLLARF